MSESYGLGLRFAWSGVAVLGRGGIAFVVFLLLARASSEEQLATYGVIYFFWNLIYITSQHLVVQPLIEMTDVNEKQIFSATINAVAVSALFAAILLSTASHIEKVYPEQLRIGVYIGYLVVLAPLSTIGLAHFVAKQREGDFKFIALYQSLASAAAALTGYLLSLRDPILGMLTVQIAVGPYFLLFCWLKKPPAYVRYERDSFSNSSRVGKHLALEGNLGVFATQGPLILFPLMIPAADAGVFVIILRSLQLIFSQLNRVVSLVLLPLMSRIDRASISLHDLFVESNKVLFGLFTIPIIVFATLSNEMPHVLGVRQDNTSVFLVQCLLLKQLLDQVSMIVATTFRATGRPSFGWQWNTFFSVVWILMFFAGTSLGLSVEYLTLIVCVVSVVSFYGLHLICRHISLSTRMFFKQMFPQYLLAFLFLLLAFYFANFAFQFWGKLLVLSIIMSLYLWRFWALSGDVIKKYGRDLM